jgi:hypothetical protein
MIELHLYVQEKLQEAEHSRRPRLALPTAPKKRAPVAAAVARTAGRRVRRLGERIEAWGTPVRSGFGR